MCSFGATRVAPNELSAISVFSICFEFPDFDFLHFTCIRLLPSVYGQHPAGQPASRTAGSHGHLPACLLAWLGSLGRQAPRDATWTRDADCGDVGTVRSLCNIKETGTGAAAAGRRARPASLCALRGSVGPESSRGHPVSFGKGCGVVDLVPEGTDSVHCQTHFLQALKFMLLHGLYVDF